MSTTNATKPLSIFLALSDSPSGEVDAFAGPYSDENAAFLIGSSRFDYCSVAEAAITFRLNGLTDGNLYVVPMADGRGLLAARLDGFSAGLGIADGETRMYDSPKDALDSAALIADW